MEKQSGYLALWIWLLFTNFCNAKDPKFKKIGNVNKIFLNGPDGECEKGLKGDGCSIGWIRRPSILSQQQVSKSKSSCKYYRRTAVYRCPKSATLGNTTVCWKKVSFYMITSSCSGAWLNWNECDAFCGFGMRERMKFIKSSSNDMYAQTIEKRPCKIRSCGTWSPWSNAVTNCSEQNCTKISERQCIFNNSVAPVKYCSGENTKDNATVESISLPCSSSECISTTAAITEISTVTPVESRKTTNSAAILSSPDSVQTKAPILPILDRVPDSTSSGIWQGIVIGFLSTSFAFILIFILLYRKKIRIIHKRSHSEKHSGSVRSDSIRMKRDTFKGWDTPDNRTSRAATLPLPQQHFINGERIPMVHAVSTDCHINRNRDEQLEPLYSDIPAFQSDHIREGLPSGVTKFSTGNRNTEMMVGIPNDEFVGNSDSFDSEEDRDVLRTLKRPSYKLKHRGSSLRSADRQPGPFRYDQNSSTSRCSSDGKIYFKSSKGEKPVSKEFEWSRHSPEGAENTAKDKETVARRPSNSSSINSIYLDTTSGYNSSIFEDSTDDEYASWFKNDPNKSDLKRKTSKLLRRKISKCKRNKAKKDPNCLTDNNKPRGRDLQCAESDLVAHYHSSESFNTAAASNTRPYHTMKPSQNRDFFIFRRNDHLISVEDVYSLPIDAILPDDTGSLHKGYKVPIDAISHNSTPL